MGLQFMKTQSDEDGVDAPLAKKSKEKGKNKNPITAELNRCIADMYNACGSAINILNDLLIFDKLEDGKLVLDKSQVIIGDLLRTSLSPFNAQVMFGLSASSALSFDIFSYLYCCILLFHYLSLLIVTYRRKRKI